MFEIIKYCSILGLLNSNAQPVTAAAASKNYIYIYNLVFNI